VPTIAVMSHSVATIWARWATRLIAVVKCIQKLQGL
jgi:hypothetical protein